MRHPYDKDFWRDEERWTRCALCRIHTYIHTYRQTDKQTDRQTDTHTEETDRHRQTHRQIDIYTHMYTQTDSRSGHVWTLKVDVDEVEDEWAWRSECCTALD